MAQPVVRPKSMIHPSEEKLISDISNLVNSLTGVQLGEKQKSMVSSRVKKRMSILGLQTDREYSDYIKAHPESETAQLVSLLTTHHTYFFREFAHFEHLETSALPQLIQAKRARGPKVISVWSAACSTGQEVYSLAMFLDYYLSKNAPDFTYEILGTDVDPASVKTAANGVYRSKEIQEVPLQFLGKHWVKGTGDIAQYVKVKKTLKDRCSFEPMNLLSPSGRGTKQKFDIIFCRNVFIYFNADQIKSITSTLLSSLSEGGELYLGVSESLNGLNLPCRIIGPSIYGHPKKQEAVTKSPTQTLSTRTASPAAAATVAPARPLRVLCVDDSPVILTLLKKILSTDAGFEVVGTAANGIEAASKLKSLQVDLMTLDIHMPEQNGLEYLKANFRKGHPPVVMITSVSREDASLPIECLKAGATDYIEKPSLTNLANQTDEIRMKLKYATKNPASADGHDLVQSLSRKSSDSRDFSRSLRVVFASLVDRRKVASLFADLKGPQPATLIVVEGLGSGGSAMTEALKVSTSGKAVEASLALLKSPPADGVLVCDSKDFFSASVTSGKQVSCIVFGDVSNQVAQGIAGMKPAQLILEENANRTHLPTLKLLATEITPATSFAYTTHEFFQKRTAA